MQKTIFIVIFRTKTVAWVKKLPPNQYYFCTFDLSSPLFGKNVCTFKPFSLTLYEVYKSRARAIDTLHSIMNVLSCDWPDSHTRSYSGGFQWLFIESSWSFPMKAPGELAAMSVLLVGVFLVSGVLTVLRCSTGLSGVPVY